MAKSKKERPQLRRKPSRTKGYYSFRKDYPAAASDGHSFPVEAEKPKLSTRGKIAAAIAAVLVFCVVFLLTDVWQNLAQRTPREEEVGSGITEQYEENALPGTTASLSAGAQG